MTYSPTVHSQNESEKEQKAPREKLEAEKKFDKRVYGGISYFAQAATGIALTYWLTFTKSGKPYYNTMSEWFGKNIIEKITSKRGLEAIEEAKPWMIVTTMVNVGNLFIPPVKWLENHKAYFVEKWTAEDNAKRELKGETITPEEKAHQEDLLKQLKAAPKQSWMSLIGGRAFALAAVFGTLHGIGKPKHQAFEDFAIGKMKQGLHHVGMSKLATSQTAENITRTSFYDVFYSMVSAGGLYVYSHFIAPPKQCVDDAGKSTDCEPANGSVPVHAHGHSPESQTLTHAEQPGSEIQRQWKVTCNNIVPQLHEGLAAHV